MNEDELAAVIAALRTLRAAQPGDAAPERIPAWRRAARLEGVDVR